MTANEAFEILTDVYNVATVEVWQEIMAPEAFVQKAVNTQGSMSYKDALDWLSEVYTLGEIEEMRAWMTDEEIVAEGQKIAREQWDYFKEE